MSIGRHSEQQGTMWIAYDQIPKSMGHAFYDRLQKILCQGKFDLFAENLCADYYAPVNGRASIPPGRYFSMLLVGYFEGLDSERGICWRCADSLSLRSVLWTWRAEQSCQPKFTRPTKVIPPTCTKLSPMPGKS